MTDNVKDTKPTIAVVTLHNSPNYGSCLQTYATQTVLSRIGATTSIVDYYRHDAIPENETERALNGQLAKKMPIFRIPGVKSLARIPVSRIVARRAKPLNDFLSLSLPSQTVNTIRWRLWNKILLRQIFTALVPIRCGIVHGMRALTRLFICPLLLKEQNALLMRLA